MPPRCIHQFLPIDTPQAGKRFLKNWRPDIAIWAEQFTPTHLRAFP